MESLKTLWGAAAGAAFVAVTQLATRSELTQYHKAALFCFSLSLPFSVMMYIAHTILILSRKPLPVFFRVIGCATGFILIVGIGLLFKTFGDLAFCGFCVAVSAATIIAGKLMSD